jgi:hypothetical protein
MAVIKDCRKIVSGFMEFHGPGADYWDDETWRGTSSLAPALSLAALSAGGIRWSINLSRLHPVAGAQAETLRA